MLKDAIREILNEQNLGMCTHEGENLGIYGNSISKNHELDYLCGSFSPILYIRDIMPYPMHPELVYADMDDDLRGAINNTKCEIDFGYEFIYLNAWFYDDQNIYMIKNGFDLYDVMDSECDEIKSEYALQYDIRKIDDFIAVLKELKRTAIERLNKYVVPVDILSLIGYNLIADLNNIIDVGYSSSEGADITFSMTKDTLNFEMQSEPHSIILHLPVPFNQKQETEVRKALRKRFKSGVSF